MKNILILCTGNSARSIMAEALIKRLGEGRVCGYSAGSHPKDSPHPAALRLLSTMAFDISEFRSKSWDEFSGKNAVPMDIVITVCDSADGEVCPVWPGAPVKAHWGIPDPAAIEGAEQDVAFEKGYERLEARIAAMMKLDLEALSNDDLQKALKVIGAQGEGATARAALA